MASSICIIEWIQQKMTSCWCMEHKFLVPYKVLYPKYSKHWPYLLVFSMGYSWSKIVNLGLEHGLFLSSDKFFGWKYILNWIENSGLKSRLIYTYHFNILRSIFHLTYKSRTKWSNGLRHCVIRTLNKRNAQGQVSNAGSNPGG
jgi:hypothetical protein